MRRFDILGTSVVGGVMEGGLDVLVLLAASECDVDFFDFLVAFFLSVFFPFSSDCKSLLSSFSSPSTSGLF